MKVRKLKEILAEVDEDLQVRLICDHGQSLMELSGSGVGYIEDIEDYMGDEVHEDDLTGGEDKVYILEAF